ncbi:MAG: ATP-binding protein [Arcicella sp.]|nr:ATP-binding protein [Arcicella sp.]
MSIIGRKIEIEEFDGMMASNKSEFLVVYGRRRVGKTYLIRQYFNNKFSFYSTGLAEEKTSIQLANFNAALRQSPFYEEQKDADNWMDAFRNLIKILEVNPEEKKVIFIDELPWMDTKDSGLILAIDFFWNSWASARNDIKFIVCGSSASWMIDNLLKNTKGLYNRVTNRIKLKPFTLKETKEYLMVMGGSYDNYQVVELYMALGGIPFYLNFIKIQESASQNINRLFFSEQAKLRDEYCLLFASLFKNYQKHIAIINALAQKKKGLFKSEIVKLSKLKDGGTLTTILKELEASDFIRKYNMPGQKVRNIIYQLTDNFTLFYQNFIEKSNDTEPNFWLNIINTPQYYAWASNAFEIVCLLHSQEIKKALGIAGIQSNTYAWSNTKSQIDLIFDRKDHVINLIEIKFSHSKFTIAKDYEAKLLNKLSDFKESYKTNKAIWIVMLTTYGLGSVNNTGSIHNSLEMSVLFE